jgi:coenzyme PQQ biosynthesis protein PqqD
VKLSSQARLRFDRVRSTWILLYPDGGMVLNRTAREIVELCQRPITRSDLLAALVARYPDIPKETLVSDTDDLLVQLETRDLLEHAAEARDGS